MTPKRKLYNNFSIWTKNKPEQVVPLAEIDDRTGGTELALYCKLCH